MVIIIGTNQSFSTLLDRRERSRDFWKLGDLGWRNWSDGVAVDEILDASMGAPGVWSVTDWFGGGGARGTSGSFFQPLSRRRGCAQGIEWNSCVGPGLVMNGVFHYVPACILGSYPLPGSSKTQIRLLSAGTGRLSCRAPRILVLSVFLGYLARRSHPQRRRRCWILTGRVFACSCFLTNLSTIERNCSCVVRGIGQVLGLS